MSGRNRHPLTALITFASRTGSAFFMIVTDSTSPVRDTQILASTAYDEPGLRSAGGNAGSAPEIFCSAPMFGGRSLATTGAATVPPGVPPGVPPSVPPGTPSLAPPLTPEGWSSSSSSSSLGSGLGGGVSRGWTMSGGLVGTMAVLGFCAIFFLAAPPPAGGGGGGGGGLADMNVTRKLGGESSSMCQ